ncbi:hypothetical protein BKA57DRAFT_218804 [Linnemannia elongata]|nr:hypothetical protein BKA57DRAFT_218804 [Linnemannia elongata]
MAVVGPVSTRTLSCTASLSLLSFSVALYFPFTPLYLCHALLPFQFSLALSCSASLSIFSFSVVLCFPFTSPTHLSSLFLLSHPIFESASARVSARVLLDSRRGEDDADVRACVYMC